MTLPSLAQAPEPTTAPTIDSAPVTIVAEEPAAIVTEESGGDVTVIVNNPPAEPDDEGGTPNQGQIDNSPITYVIIVVLALIVVASLVFNAQITRLLATMVPPETASSIYQAGVRFGLQVALNEAAKTETSADDDFFKKLAADRGLEVNRLANGLYEVKYMPPPQAAG
jgi:hypothetical protein